VRYDRKDAYYRQARAAGYRARSACKLVELDRRFGLLRRGDYVIDLGCWPGGWLQVALEAVGPEGRVVGVDMAPVEPLTARNAVVLQADVRDPATTATVVRRLGRRADAVLSDLSPGLTGIRATDEARCADLTRATLGTLPTLLRPGGRFLTKVFMSAECAALVGEVRQRFATVHATRPVATRRGSAELYVIGLGFEDPPAS